MAFSAKKMSWQHSIDIYGIDFFPSRVPFEFTEAWDPLTKKTSARGPFEGQLLPSGGARFVVPQSVEINKRIEYIAERIVPILGRLRECGAETWSVWIIREYHAQCNEELFPWEIAALSRLQCSLCYSAFEVAEENEKDWPNQSISAQRASRVADC